MSGIEKIQRYIELTETKFIRGTPYQMHMDELLSLRHMSREDVSDALCLAFDFGRAKGYRAAKAEVEKA